MVPEPELSPAAACTTISAPSAGRRRISGPRVRPDRGSCATTSQCFAVRGRRQYVSPPAELNTMCAVPAGSTTAAGESPAPRSIAGAAAAGGAPARRKARATLPAHLRITRSLLGDGRGRLQRALDLRPEVHRARELG